jgi:hypothetical protein
MSTTTRLSPHVLAEIVDRFGIRPPWNMRESLRFPLQSFTVEARPERPGGPAEPFEIEIIDLAVSGIGFKTRTPVTPGTLFTIELAIPGVTRQLWCCRVVSVHESDSEHRRAGAEFHTIAEG